MFSGLDAHLEEMPRSSQKSIPRRGAMCSIHGELHPDSIIVVREPGPRQIASVVDWGLAGWYPKYWKCVSMQRFVLDREWSKEG
jgi:hypothetical protein